jgi:hypothetical protein
MDQLRLDFKLNFSFYKNTRKFNIFYLYKYFTSPKNNTNYLYLNSSCIDEREFNEKINKNDFKKTVEIDNGLFVVKNRFLNKKMICRKILFKKKYFINLLYF